MKIQIFPFWSCGTLRNIHVQCHGKLIVLHLACYNNNTSLAELYMKHLNAQVHKEEIAKA
jgi:hypothetical protein